MLGYRTRKGLSETRRRVSEQAKSGVPSTRKGLIFGRARGICAYKPRARCARNGTAHLPRPPRHCKPVCTAARTHRTLGRSRTFLGRNAAVLRGLHSSCVGLCAWNYPASPLFIKICKNLQKFLKVDSYHGSRHKRSAAPIRAVRARAHGSAHLGPLGTWGHCADQR